MASLTLDRMWINLASAPDTYVTIRQASWPETYAVPAEVRRMANGRDRLVTSPGATTAVQVSAPFVDYATWRSLKTSFSGVVVLLRDGRGFREWGVIANVTGNPDRATQNLRDVSFDFTRITWSEAV